MVTVLLIPHRASELSFLHVFFKELRFLGELLSHFKSAQKVRKEMFSTEEVIKGAFLCTAAHGVCGSYGVHKGSRFTEDTTAPVGHVGISFHLCLYRVARVHSHPRGGVGG